MRIVLTAACVGVVVGAVACGSPGASGTPAPGSQPTADATHPLFGIYKTAVSDKAGRHFTVYWLGAYFTARSTEFGPPGIAGFSAQNTPEGIQTDYSGGPRSALSLDSYSKAGFEAVKDAQLPARLIESQTAVTLGSHQGVLYRIPLGGRPNLLVVVVDAGDTVIVASTIKDSGNPNATPNANPLFDEATFIAVLQRLRPYPQ